MSADGRDVGGRTEGGASNRSRAAFTPKPGSVALAVLAPALAFLVLGAAWELVASGSPSLLPELSRVASDLGARPGWYLDQAWETVQSALIGLVLGVAVALVLAVAMVQLRGLRAAIMPIALLVNSTPIVAIAPALIVAFGFTRTPHVITVAICVFFPMLVNAWAGLRAVDPEAADVFTTLAATRWDELLRLRLPSSVPFLFAGLKVSASSAMMGAIVSEFTGTASGLGASIVSASTTFLNLGQLWGCILVSALVTLALVGLVAALERAVVRW